MIVLRCWRGLRTLVPVPGAAGVREKSSAPRSLWNDSSGSAALNAIGFDSAGGLVAQAEVVVEELAPGPSPLRDVVLGEQVLADVVEDAVADVSARWGRQ